MDEGNTLAPAPLMAAALDYAARGWRVLPCYPGEKRPALKDWPNKATTDPKVIADWWIENPDYNIGLATGDDFFVLDVDPKNGGDESLVRLVTDNGHALPTTRTIRTPSTGRHFYFAVPADLDFDLGNARGELKGYPGLDIRGAGGQVLAPPSATAFGSYTLHRDAPILHPEWLLELLRPRPVEVPVNGTARVDSDDYDRLRDYAVNVALPAAARAVASAPEGNRNQTLNDNVLALAGIAAHDETLIGMHETWETLAVACRENGLLLDEPEECIATLKSAWSAGLERPRLDWPPRDPGAGLLFDDDSVGFLPIVMTSGRKRSEVVDEVLSNLVKANDAEPTLFLHGTETVKVVAGGTVHLDNDLLSYEAEQRMNFVRRMPNGGEAVTDPPKRVVDTILALPSKELPRLDRLSSTPFFAPSGDLVSRPGYHAEASTFFSPAAGLVVPSELDTSPVTIASAKALLSEMIGDFPFVTDSDRAHAWALMLLPFVRDMIDGPTPLHNIEAPTPGSGKGLLTKALLLPGTGGDHVTFGAPGTNDEWEKKLVSILRDTPAALVIDNVNDKITSGFLCMALTEGTVTSRVLGGSTTVRMPVRCAWVLTANNPRFSDEVARRTVRIRVDADTERPEDRTGFAHPELLRWATERRSSLVAACCTLVGSWVEAGAPQPVPARPFGSFESWQAVMAGLLDHIGVPGLLANKADFQAASDEETGAWGQLVGFLLLSVEEEWSSALLAEIVLAHGFAIDLGKGNPALAMGRALSRQRDRWHLGRRFRSRIVRGRTMWALTESGES